MSRQPNKAFAAEREKLRPLKSAVRAACGGANGCELNH